MPPVILLLWHEMHGGRVQLCLVSSLVTGEAGRLTD